MIYLLAGLVAGWILFGLIGGVIITIKMNKYVRMGLRQWLITIISALGGPVAVSLQWSVYQTVAYAQSSFLLARKYSRR